jgi:hypothetical protein
VRVDDQVGVGFGGGGAAVVVNDTVAGVVDLLPARSTATTETVWPVDGDRPVMAYERVPIVGRTAGPPSMLTSYPARP